MYNRGREWKISSSYERGLGKETGATMSKCKRGSILQTAIQKRKENINADSQQEEIHRIPTNHRQAERKLISSVRSGELEIDLSGKIWRVKMRKGIRGGGVQTISVKRRRAEHKTPLGYLQVRSMHNGKRIHALAHRLIWQYFFGDIPDGLIINHKNGIKNDNRPRNLEIVTYSESLKHAHRLGLIDQTGERNPNAKLSNKQVEEIRELYASGNYQQVDLAKMFNISFQTISKIVRGERRRKQAGPIVSGDQRRRHSK